MSKRKWLLIILVLIICVGVFFVVKHYTDNDSEKTQYTEDGKLIVTVSMFNNSSFPQWRAYVEKQCPDVYINWENNLNAASNVLYQAKHGNMPDIVSIRRFESDTTAQLDKYLLDLSDLKITKTYKSKYLKPYQLNGKQYWLPEPGLFDTIIANKTLFDRYGVDIPTDWDSFVAACKAMEGHNIAAFDTDCLSPWTPTAIIQGFGSAAYLNTDSGSAWANQFKEGDVKTVDEKGFSNIADVLRELHDAKALTNQDLTSDLADVDTRLTAENAAMSIKSSDSEYDSTAKGNFVALPYFGKTSKSNCLLSYPVFSLGVSSEVKNDPQKQKAVEEVLNVMLSKKAQQILNQNSEGLISYNKGIHLKLSSSMKYVKTLIEDDRCFIRTLNSNTFSANSLALTALIKDNASDEEFVNVLNDNLFKKVTDKKVADSNIEAKSEFDTDAFCPAAGVIADTLKAEAKTDFTLIDTDEAASDIYKGEYTNKDLAAVVVADPVYTAELTGADIEKLIQTCVYYSTTFSNGSTESMLEYPAVSGMKVSIKKNGTVTGIYKPKNGDIKADKKYSIAISGSIYNALILDKNHMAAKFKLTDKNLLQYFTEYFSSKGKLPMPKNYFDVQ